jgi:hypothetical protein
MKYLKSFEHYDSPELKGSFSDEEIKKLAFSDDPYSKSGFKRFQHGFYAGDKPSGNLNDLMSKSYLKNSDYGISDYLYKELIKNIPDFKDYKLTNYDDFYDGKVGLHLKKQEKLEGTRFNAESEIWVYFHSKGNKTFSYKKGKFYLLFTCGLRPDHSKSTSLFGNPKGDDLEKELNNSFADMIKPCTTGCEKDPETGVDFDEKKFDNFLKKLNDIGYGHPDDEDEKLHDRLMIYHKNLSISTFLKILPKVKNNLDYFKKYLRNKYKMSI